MTIHNTHADTNGTHLDTKHIKTEQISPNHDTKIQVKYLSRKGRREGGGFNAPNNLYQINLDIVFYFRQRQS
jgi:hypothetical protein